MKNYPTKIIECPDCGIKCNFVANCFAEMPFSYPGSFHPHECGSKGCLSRQIEKLKKQIKQLKARLDRTRSVFK